MEDTKLTLCVVADGWSWGWGAATPVDGTEAPAQFPPIRVFLLKVSHYGISCVEGSPEDKNVLNYYLI